MRIKTDETSQTEAAERAGVFGSAAACLFLFLFNHRFRAEGGKQAGLFLETLLCFYHRVSLTVTKADR